MKKIIKDKVDAVAGFFNQALDGINDGVTFVQDKFNGLSIFMSLESAASGDGAQYDEKHYFVIPFYRSEYKFALHTMRCLPDSVGELNNLPKRRVFHFANESAEYALREYMLMTAKEAVEERKAGETHTLENLADDIDQLESKLTFGLLAVGGIAAIFNPLIGAGIAAKALLPGAAGLLSKYGIRPMGQKLSRKQLENEVKAAEKQVLDEFSQSSTLKVINPILAELEFALNTSEEEHDPLLDPNLAEGSIPELQSNNWRYFTESAICHVYKDVYADKSLHASAKLGPEDIRWLKTLYESR